MPGERSAGAEAWVRGKLREFFRRNREANLFGEHNLQKRSQI